MAGLFSPQDLRDWLRAPVTPEAAAIAEKVVWGWLRPVLGIAERPITVPAEVFSWAVELGAIAHENPTGLEYYQLGPERQGYSVERRNQILRDAESYAGTINGGTSPGGPQGCFPPAQPWPDAARGW